mmetsp:Transcript_36748/g.80062  ORF Transcript_36748/g.80062 Transcript_36748/m.80062 type:complete len:221 (+) Transcript_36748:247-909(+)
MRGASARCGGMWGEGAAGGLLWPLLWPSLCGVTGGLNRTKGEGSELLWSLDGGVVVVVPLGVGGGGAVLMEEGLGTAGLGWEPFAAGARMDSAVNGLKGSGSMSIVKDISRPMSPSSSGRIRPSTFFEDDLLSCSKSPVDAGVKGGLGASSTASEASSEASGLASLRSVSVGGRSSDEAAGASTAVLKLLFDSSGSRVAVVLGLGSMGEAVWTDTADFTG